MISVTINKRFANAKECQEWEDVHLNEYVPKGKKIFMVNHQEELGKDTVILENILCIGG